MPEIKNTFVQGKMNKDLDERLLPNGQYRDAMNVQVSTSEGSDVGTVQNVLGNQSLGGLSGECVGSITDEKNNKLYWFITTATKDAIYEYSEGTTPEPIFIDTKAKTPDAVLEFGNRIITGINIIDDFIFWTDGSTEPKKINITRSKTGTVDAFTHTKLVVGGSIVQEDDGSGTIVDVDTKKEHVTVIKKKPTSKLNVKLLTSAQTTLSSGKPSLFEKTLSRFSYRYKYEDGEYSAFGPFTDVIFNPLYPDGKDNTTYFLPKDPYNLAMLNKIDSIELYDFIGPDTPKDVVQVDILYKQENSPTVYSIVSIKPDDSIPAGYGQNYWNSAGYGQNTDLAGTSKYKGRYPITFENIRAAVPEKQLLRLWDNVPKKALSQEITGSRLVYGNYTQNYNININPEISIDYGSRVNYSFETNQYFADFSNKGLYSVKSQRNYQLGVVFGDEYGRETPVFSSTNSAVKIPWDSPSGLSASQSHQLKAHISSDMPNWADYYKFYIKQTSGEYYNLVMDRAYTPAEYAEGEDHFDHIWVSFASSDRNKISENDYLILKKKLDNQNMQFAQENRFKILDIKNEAPDAIKFKYNVLGKISNFDSGGYNGHLDDNPTASDIDELLDTNGNYITTFGIFPSKDLRIDVENCNVLQIDKSNWEMLGREGASLTLNDDASNDIQNLFVSWRTSTTASKRYKVSNNRVSNPYNEFTQTGNAQYMMKLEEDILAADADIARHSTDDGTHRRLNEDLTFVIERKDEKNHSEFSGRFFVKIIRDLTTSDQLQQQSLADAVDVMTVVTEAKACWLADDQTNAVDTDFSLAVAPSGTSNHTVAEITGGAAGELTTTKTQWTSLVTHTKNNDTRFFIDNMYFAAGQNSSDSFAKNSGEIVAGWRMTYAQQNWDNTIPADQKHPPTSAGYNSNFAWEADHPIGTHLFDLKKNYYPRVLSGQYQLNLINPTSDNNTNDIYIWTEAGTGSSPVPAHTGNFAPGFAVADDYHNEIGNAWAPYYLNAEKATSRWSPFGRDSREGWRETSSIYPPNNNGWMAKGYSFDFHNTYQYPQILSGTFGMPNVMEGIIQTDSTHTSNASINGRRKWRQPGQIQNGDFIESNVYGGVNGKVFMHLSFLAPGVDLVPDSMNLTNVKVRGYYGLANHLQGIWGGGTFVPDDDTNSTLAADPNTPGDGAYDPDGFPETLIECEGHYVLSSGDNRADSEWYTEPNAPGPGVGQGYNMDYADQHYNQWKINYPNTTKSQSLQNFADSLAQGTVFRFSEDPDEIDYTIVSQPIVKRLYNHTPWRKTKVSAAGDDWDVRSNRGDSVEEAAITWARSLGSATDEATNATALIDKIKDFGRADNRRLVYIIELDKNPTDPTVSPNFNPINGNNGLTASSNSKIRIISEERINLTGRVNTIPAVFETEPKSDSGLDIYYEASGIIPCDINITTREIYAPVGCRVEILNSDGSKFFVATNGNINIIDPQLLQYWGDINMGQDVRQVFVQGKTNTQNGFNKLDPGGINDIVYDNKYLRFYRADGSYTTAEIDSVGSSSGDYVTSFIIKNKTNELEAGLSWYNCFSFGDGVESDRIRDDFNEMRITNGSRASTTIDEPYEEDHRKYGLIFSGLYNSNSALNELNQFIMAEKITKDLNPTYGSIQKLFSRNTDLVTFCEDRVVKVLSNKDAVFNADGNPQLTANVNVLGQTIPFVGDYGISTNPESFAKQSYRAYFADKQRGAILRLSKDGLTPISDAGMHDWFRDNLRLAGRVIGSYDAFKENYNVTLKEAISTNLLFNAGIEKGTLLEYTQIDSFNYAENLTGTGYDETSARFSGTGYQPWQSAQDHFVSSSMNPGLSTYTVIKEYPTIPAGYFQAFSAAGTVIQESSNETFNNTNASTSIRQMAAYGGGTNGFNNVTGAPSHNQERLINDSIPSTDNGTDYNLASGVNNNIWHFGQGQNSVTTSPSGGGINATEWATINKGIVFQSYPNLNDTSPVSLDPDTSFLKTPMGYGFISSARHNFFAGTEIINFTSTSGTGLFETVPSGGLTMPMTVFNGEEVEIKIKFHIPPYQDTAQGASDATNGPTISNLLTSADVAPDTNKPGSGIYKAFEIKLHEGTPASDGSTVIASGLLMDPQGGNPNDPYTYQGNGFNSDYQTSPIFQTFGTIPTLDTSPEKEDTFTLKFTDGTENANIVVEDLKVSVHLIFTDSLGNKYTDPSLQIGSAVLDYLYILKRYRLEDVGTPAITQQADVPAIPAATIPAWTEVVIPDYPAIWSSQTPWVFGVPARDYFEMREAENLYGQSNPPTAQSQNASTVDMSTGAVTTGGTYSWYEGASNGVTGYQDVNIYTTPNEIYDISTHTYTTQTDNNGDDIIQPGVNDTVRVKAQTNNSNWTNFRLPITNTNTGDKLEIGAWYCVDVWADGNGLEPVTHGTWSPTGQGGILVYDVCNTNLVLDGNDELHWGAGGSTTERYPEGHLGKIISGDTIAVGDWYGDANDGTGVAGQTITRRHIALEYYKPNMKDSSRGAGGVWTLAEGTERNNINTNTYGATWNDGNPSYRAIFQIHPNSNAAKSDTYGTNYLTHLNLVFAQCDIDVKTIIIAKIQNPTNTDPTNDTPGQVFAASPSLLPTISSSAPWITHGWWRSAADNGVDFSGFRHGLVDPKAYYLEDAGQTYGGLNFDGNSYFTAYDGNDYQYRAGASAVWYHYFYDHPYANPAASIGYDSPQESVEGWELAFEVNKGVDKFGVPRANVEGGFNCRLTNKVGDAPNGADLGGFEFGNIQHDGHYKVTGNMDGNGPYEILYKGPHSSTPTHYVDYNTITTAPIGNIGSINTWLPLTSDSYAAQINFYSHGSQPHAFVGAIKDITLINKTDYFSGGSIDSWSTSGFDPIDDDFIFFDNQTNPQNPAIGFNSAPYNAIVTDRVQIYQEISNVIYSNQSFLIQFEYDITGGEIECYYFNNAGNGFRVPPITSAGVYSVTHIIGELDPNTGSAYVQNADELTNTFVIFISSGTVTGTIDNLIMKEQISLTPRHMYSTPDENPDVLAPSTLTYNEGVKGWVSFKSFLPEQGLSLAKKYYTIKNGNLHEHHAPGISRNLFYSNFVESSLTAVLNQEPSTIKMFNTLNYEGSQSKIDQYLTGSGLSNISTYNLQAKTGWYANYIHTDKQRGSIKEFIEKEGKWFNYIKGIASQDILDTAEFSFQGLGIVSSVINTDNQSL